MPGMPMSSTAAEGLWVRTHLERRGTVVCGQHVGAEATQQSAEALGRVDVVVDHEDALARDPCSRRARLLRQSTAGSWSSGRRTTNSLPDARAGAARLDGAAVQRDDAAHQRQADAETALRTAGALGLREQLEDFRQARPARMPTPLSRTDDRRPDRRAARARELDLAAVVRVLRRVVEQVAEDLREPHRIGVELERLAAEIDRQSVVPAASISGRAGLDRAADRRASRSTRCLRSSILPRVMRDTSSRSSTSRTR